MKYFYCFLDRHKITISRPFKNNIFAPIEKIVKAILKNIKFGLQ